MASRVLLVDDEEAVCWSLRRALIGEGHQVDVAPTAEAALEIVALRPPQVVILDVRLPGMDGLTALETLRRLVPDVAVIVITAYGDMGTAIRALHGGAFEYLPKPFDLEVALQAVRRALAKAARPVEPPPTAPPPPEGLVGHCKAMQEVFKRIALAAPQPACVLIAGESGTGKELVARALHRHSPRANQSFLPLHVGALNPNLVESELFGHVRGAFTGATENRPGLLGLADGGTLFLDEVAEIPLSVQVKLLRVLEHGEYVPVGGTQPQRLNVRILAATHKDLLREAATGSFRHDLYYRLNVFPIRLPPLRERAEDISLLVEHFLRLFEPRSWSVPEETLRFLAAQPWPGNVRELRNALEHACILARHGPLLPEHFPPPSSIPTEGGTTAESRLQADVRDWLAGKLHGSGGKPADLHGSLLACVERVLLEEVLRHVHGNRWEAARWLGLHRATVRKKLVALGLAPAGDEGQAEEGE
jgi:two-component system, NtrC family, nitrogen regulation response regulator GlnG